MSWVVARPAGDRFVRVARGFGLEVVTEVPHYRVRLVRVSQHYAVGEKEREAA